MHLIIQFHTHPYHMYIICINYEEKECQRNRHDWAYAMRVKRFDT